MPKARLFDDILSRSSTTKPIVIALSIGFAAAISLGADPNVAMVQPNAAARLGTEQRRLPSSNAPTYSHAYQAAVDRLADHFGRYQSERFVLLTDASEARAAVHAQWLERSYEEFERFAAELRLDPQPQEHKLVCVLFEHRHEYEEFARSHDGVGNKLISGYYSPRHDRVVFALEPQDHDSMRNFAPPIRANAPAEISDEPAVMQFDPQATPHQHQHCASAGAAKCVHETIHQLMFHTRIMNPDVLYPLWICEGLSTAFETEDPSRAFGPDVDFQPRLEMFRAMIEQDKLIPLRDLVTICRLPSDQPGRVKSLYNQSYALTTWLCRERPEQMREYLRLLRHQPRGRISDSKLIKLFEGAFGDLDQLESAWLRDQRAN